VTAAKVAAEEKVEKAVFDQQKVELPVVP